MRKLSAHFVLLALVTGCAVGPNYKQPAVPAPDQYREVQGPPPSAPSLADQPWWEVFKDPKLQAYIDQALMGGHLWRHHWDPEGVLSTVPAISTGR